MKTRYAIIEPGPMIPEQLIALQGSKIIQLGWVDCEFTVEPEKAQGRKVITDPRAYIPLAEFHDILDPLFPGTDWERVAVNSFKGPGDMFVDEFGALAADGRAGPLPVNEAATLIYWSAMIMHQIDKEAGPRLPTYAAMRLEALRRAASAINGPELASGLYRNTPRIHGRAVLFEDRVWF